MKKTISIILCAVLLISMFGVMSASAAPAGEAINSEADFAAMKEGGVYYLNSDITVSASYVAEFKGTLDGNGKTVTVNNVPMFQTFSGKVSNLTIRGDITGNTDLGALAVKTNGLVAINCKNYANVKVTGANADNTSGFRAGGFVADADEKGQSLCVFRDCANFGAITVETNVIEDADKGLAYETDAGGFMGRSAGFDAKFCENSGNINAPCNQGKAAGFVARACWVNSSLSDFNYYEVQDCVNSGNITSGYDAGAYGAYVGCSNNDIARPYKVDYCVNTGAIVGGYRVGGFIGYSYASGKNLTYWLEITNSIQIGDVTAGQAATNLKGDTQYTFVSLFVGYSNSVHNKIQNCIGMGELKALASPTPDTVPYTTPFFVMMGCSSAKTPNCEFSNNYMYDNNTTVWYSYATSESNASQQIPIETAISEGKVTRVTADVIKNGTAATNINNALGTNIFEQGANDTAPKMSAALVAERRAADKVLKGEDIQVNYETEETKNWADTTEEITNAPKPTTEATTTEVPDTQATTPAPSTTAGTEAPAEKGCGGMSVAAIAVALVSIVGCALIKKH